MTQTTLRSQGLLTVSEKRHWARCARKPVVEERTCANCLYFQSHNEPQSITDEKGQSFPNPRHGCGWCSRWSGSTFLRNGGELQFAFDQPTSEHHQMTRECVLNGALDVEVDKAIVTHELKDNLTFFPEVEYEESTNAFPSEEIIDPYDLPHSEYEVGSVVKIIDKDEHHSEWGVFEVIERKHNQSLYKNADTYLQQPQWYYRLASKDTAQKMDDVWVREDEAEPKAQIVVANPSGSGLLRRHWCISTARLAMHSHCASF